MASPTYNDEAPERHQVHTTKTWRDSSGSDSKVPRTVVDCDVKPIRRPRRSIDAKCTSFSPLKLSKSSARVDRKKHYSAASSSLLSSSCSYDGDESANATNMSSNTCFVNLFEDEDFIRQQREIMEQFNSSSSTCGADEEPHGSSPQPSSYAQDQATCTTASLSTNFSINTTGSDDSDDGFLSYMNDPEFLREQQEVMAQIAASQRDLKTSSSSKRHENIVENNDLKSLCSNVVKESQRLHNRPEKNDEAIALSPPPRNKRKPAPTKPPSLNKPTSKPSLDKASVSSAPRDLKVDTTTRNDTPLKCPTREQQVGVYNGKKLRIRGTDHTWKQIAKGNATVVQCPSCQTFLQVGSKAKLVYCGKCGSVTPIDTILQARSTRNNATSTRADTPLAVAMQSQELEIALAKKMAKSDRKKTSKV